jgi:hypothetical protein
VESGIVYAVCQAQVFRCNTYFVAKDSVWVHNLKDDKESKGSDDDWEKPINRLASKKKNLLIKWPASPQPPEDRLV